MGPVGARGPRRWCPRGGIWGGVAPVASRCHNLIPTLTYRNQHQSHLQRSGRAHGGARGGVARTGSRGRIGTRTQIRVQGRQSGAADRDQRPAAAANCRTLRAEQHLNRKPTDHAELTYQEWCSSHRNGRAQGRSELRSCQRWCTGVRDRGE